MMKNDKNNNNRVNMNNRQHSFGFAGAQIRVNHKPIAIGKIKINLQKMYTIDQRPL